MEKSTGFDFGAIKSPESGQQVVLVSEEGLFFRMEMNREGLSEIMEIHFDALRKDHQKAANEGRVFESKNNARRFLMYRNNPKKFHYLRSRENAARGRGSDNSESKTIREDFAIRILRGMLADHGPAHIAPNMIRTAIKCADELLLQLELVEADYLYFNSEREKQLSNL